jgi:hypothetical protein
VKRESEPERVSLGDVDPIEALKALLAVVPDRPPDERDDGVKPSPKPAKSSDGE